MSPPGRLLTNSEMAATFGDDVGDPMRCQVDGDCRDTRKGNLPAKCMPNPQACIRCDPTTAVVWKFGPPLRLHAREPPLRCRLPRGLAFRRERPSYNLANGPFRGL